MLEKVDDNTFKCDLNYQEKNIGYIKSSQVEVCHKIASYIEEILDEERKQNELSYNMRKKNVT
jgi:hypothetical protein